MDYFEIDGPTTLHGDVRIAGAKNASLPLMAAALLSAGGCAHTVEIGTPPPPTAASVSGSGGASGDPSVSGIGASSEASVSTGSLNFAALQNAATMEVWNSGGGQLSYAITDNAAWLTVSPSAGTSRGSTSSPSGVTVAE